MTEGVPVSSQKLFRGFDEVLDNVRISELIAEINEREQNLENQIKIIVNHTY